MNLFFVAQAAQAALPGVGAPDLMPSLWRMLLALAVVLGLLGGLGWLLRKGLPGRRGSGGLGVESALALGERRSLVVVSVDGRRLLLGLAPNHVALVAELGPAPSFAAVVSKAIAGDGRS